MTKETKKQKETVNTSGLWALGDRVIVLPDNKGEMKSTSGIIMPPSEENLTGVIVDVGPGKRGDGGNNIPMDLVKGQRVVIGRYGHEEIAIEGKKYLIVPESSLLAIID